MSTIYSATTQPLYNVTPQHYRMGRDTPLQTLAQQVKTLQAVEKDAQWVMKNVQSEIGKTLLPVLMEKHATVADAIDDCMNLLHGLQPLLVSFEKVYDAVLTAEDEILHS